LTLFRRDRGAALARDGDGYRYSLFTKDLFCGEGVVAMAAQSQVTDGRRTTECVCKIVIELEPMAALAAPALLVHVGALP
jgi:hypothetical protein